MAGRNYERLDIEVFGRHLLDSGDLDPIYIALVNMRMDDDRLKRWLIAYWCLYHAGAASYISEAQGANFWKRMMVAAKNEEPTPTGERWPRGHERRHFRGEAAKKAVRTLHGKYFDMPEKLVDEIIEGGGGGTILPFELISQRAQKLPLFGPWISFKIGDMCERVLGIDVDFNNAAVFMFDDPTKAALMLWRKLHGFAETVKPKDQGAVINGVVDHLLSRFEKTLAPPRRDRPLGLQEIETILCKWKSHCNGHYPLWNDIDEINVGLQPWTKHSETAEEFLAAMPQRQ